MQCNAIMQFFLVHFLCLSKSWHTPAFISREYNEIIFNLLIITTHIFFLHNLRRFLHRVGTIFWVGMRWWVIICVIRKDLSWMFGQWNIQCRGVSTGVKASLSTEIFFNLKDPLKFWFLSFLNKNSKHLPWKISGFFLT